MVSWIGGRVYAVTVRFHTHSRQAMDGGWVCVNWWFGLFLVL